MEVVILLAVSTGAENAGDPGPDPEGTEWTRRYQALYMLSSLGIRGEQELGGRNSGCRGRVVIS